jgi:hypothetical protein
MSAFNHEELLRHAGHNIACVTYGEGENVALECEDCNEVLLDYDRPSEFKEPESFFPDHQVSDIEMNLEAINEERRLEGLDEIYLSFEQLETLIENINDFDYEDYNNYISDCIRDVITF